MNDFRIYDHALSAKEVHEIAKGLILHYPLNRGGFGNDNLIKGTDEIITIAQTSNYTSVSRTKTYQLTVDPKQLLLDAKDYGLTLSYDISVPAAYQDTSQTLKRAGCYLSCKVTNISSGTSVNFYGHHSVSGTATSKNKYAKTSSLNTISSSATSTNPDTSFVGHYSRYIYPNNFNNLSAFFANPNDYNVTIAGIIA